MADSHSKPKEAKSYATQPKTKMAFDMGKPLKCGFLKKKGDKIKLVKERFFVLYPNFLVYYADATKWQFDKTVGRLEVSLDLKLARALPHLQCFVRVGRVPSN